MLHLHFFRRLVLLSFFDLVTILNCYLNINYFQIPTTGGQIPTTSGVPTSKDSSQPSSSPLSSLLNMKPTQLSAASVAFSNTPLVIHSLLQHSLVLSAFKCGVQNPGLLCYLIWPIRPLLIVKKFVQVYIFIL
jgi:hypothetical protein